MARLRAIGTMTFIFSFGKVKVMPWCFYLGRWGIAVNFKIGCIALMRYPYDTMVAANRARAAKDLGLDQDAMRSVFFTHADKIPK